MSWLRRADGQFAVGLILLAILGAVLLAQPGALAQAENDAAYFWARNLWRVAFDALSAACGVGLLANDFSAGYTDQGRWTLSAIGLAGALLYLATTLRIARRLGVGHARVGASLLTFLVLLLLAIGVAGLTRWATIGLPAWSETAWGVSASLASLGWPLTPDTWLDPWIWTVAAWLSGGAASVWLASLFAAPNIGTRVAQWLLASLGYAAFLLLIATIICALESPRGDARPAPTSQSLTDNPLVSRFGRSLITATLASGSGIPVERINDAGVRDATKAVLAFVVFVGGLDGALDGGLKLPLLLAAFSAAGWALGRAQRSADQPGAIRWHAVALASVFWMLLLIAICATGLLLIENLTAARFQPAPSFADAFLDAASTVCGAGLTSGLIATVTSPNLTSGIGLGVNMYQWGIVWLMLFMLIGRVLPLMLLRRATEQRPND